MEQDEHTYPTPTGRTAAMSAAARVAEERRLLQGARVVSAVFTPLTIPFLAFLALFLFSYLRIMPFGYKAMLLGVVYCFTVLMPLLAVFVYRRFIASAEERGDRQITFALITLSYACCLVLMWWFNLPWYLTNIILASVVTTVLCALADIRWQLSEHMAGTGLATGCAVAFGEVFAFNPVWLLCLLLLASGLVGTARIILRRHNVAEVAGGYALGLGCSLLMLLPGPGAAIARLLP